MPDCRSCVRGAIRWQEAGSRRKGYVQCALIEPAVKFIRRRRLPGARFEVWLVLWWLLLDEALEFWVVVEADEVFVAGGPLGVSVAGFDGPAECG